MKFVLGSFLAMALMLSLQVHAASDLACAANQTQDEVRAQIGALLSRGFLAAGNKYDQGVGGFHGIGQPESYVESVWISKNLKLTHSVVGGDEAYSIEGSALLTTPTQFKKEVEKVSGVIEKTLSAEDGSALEGCNQLLN